MHANSPDMSSIILHLKRLAVAWSRNTDTQGKAYSCTLDHAAIQSGNLELLPSRCVLVNLKYHFKLKKMERLKLIWLINTSIHMLRHSLE